MVNIIFLFASSLSSDGNELQLHIPVALVPKEEIPIPPSVGPKKVRTPSWRGKNLCPCGVKTPVNLAPAYTSHSEIKRPSYLAFRDRPIFKAEAQIHFILYFGE
jgi:hypothetical protein